MTFKISELMEIGQGINGLLTAALPVQFSWRVSRFAKKLITELNLVQEKRNDLIKKYSSNAKSVDPDKTDEFQKEYDALLEQNLDIDFVKIPVSEISQIAIPAAALLACSPLFEE